MTRPLATTPTIPPPPPEVVCVLDATATNCERHDRSWSACQAARGITPP